MSVALLSPEQSATFECFGSDCSVTVSDAAWPGEARAAVVMAKTRMLDWHAQFSRFRLDSELTQLNNDPRETVAVTPMMRRVAQAAVAAALATGGLVDPTLVAEIERAGYTAHLDGPGLSLDAAIAAAPARAVAGPSRSPGWRTITVDRRAGTVSRPPGVKLDPGGIAKGVFADELAASLSSYDAFVVDCAGDIRLGGRAGVTRRVHVADPFEGPVVHTYELVRGAVATSGIGRRSWAREDGSPAHHLLDPRTGAPAFTGVAQATALAATAADAEALSKAALLSGPQGAPRWLSGGGVIVLEDGSARVTP